MLPDWLRDKLASPPEAGAGVHAWLFSVARQLHVHMPASAIEAALQAATANAGRRVSQREIRDAVNNSQAVAWQPKPFSGGVESVDTQSRKRDPEFRGSANKLSAGVANRPAGNPYERWPKPDATARRVGLSCAYAEGVASLYDLWERAPVQPEKSADDWLDWLFPEAEWLCLAVDHPATARTRLREKWSFGPAEECGLVVPSPMTGPSGLTLGGERSHRCLDNTGPRRWLVIEFDKLPIDEQAALHWHFRDWAAVTGWPRLRLCVHSGGKSLHGWYGPVTSEDRAHELMAYAVIFGADPATWNRCQLVRLPGGARNGARLEVFYFDPICPTILLNSSTAHGAEQDSTLPLLQTAA